MGVRGLLHHGGERRAVQVRVVLARPAHGAQDIAAAVGLLADEHGVILQIGPVGQSSASSELVSLMVASGVPSSCAAAATTPPRSVSFCSRASAICVACSASDIPFISVTIQRE